jgi:hypothetical protein
VAALPCSLSADAPCLWQEKRVITRIIIIIWLVVQEVVEAADAVIAAVDETALAKHLARKTPEEGPGAAARKKEAEEQKAALLDALEKKASALLELHPTAPEKSASAESPGEQVWTGIQIHSNEENHHAHLCLINRCIALLPVPGRVELFACTTLLQFSPGQPPLKTMLMSVVGAGTSSAGCL